MNRRNGFFVTTFAGHDTEIFVYFIAMKVVFELGEAFLLIASARHRVQPLHTNDSNLM